MDLPTATWIFWLSFGILLYTWLGYPLLLFLLERTLFRPIRKGDIEPTVTIVLCAHNEEEQIGAKIENLLALDYPAAKLQIIIASDGSFDRTNELVLEYEKRSATAVDLPSVSLRAFPTRRGKPSVLNDVVPGLAAEIVILCDARQRLETDVVRKLIGNFADAEVGGVSGELMFETPDCAGIATSTDTYWTYEKWIREKESGIHSTIGGTGALFALRRSAYKEIPPETILDDVVLPFQIIAQGYRVVIEMGARAWDRAENYWQREFERKTRTLSGNFQILFSLVRMGPGLHILGLHGMQYFGHKVTRLLGPLCLVAVFLANWQLVLLTPSGTPAYLLYKIGMVGQVCFYLTALFGGILQHRTRALPGFLLPYSFLVMQLAVVVGFLRFASGRDDVLWEKAHAIDPTAGRQRIWRLFIDSTIFVAGFFAAFYLRYLGHPPRQALESYLALFPFIEIPLLGEFYLRLAFPVMIVIPLAVFYFYRVNEPTTEEITPEYFLTLLKGVFVATLILLGMMYAMRASLLKVRDEQVVSFPLSVLLLGFLLNCLVIGGWRWVQQYIAEQSENTDRVTRNFFLAGATTAASVEMRNLATSFNHPSKLYAMKELLQGDPVTTSVRADRQLQKCLRMVTADGVLVKTDQLSRQEVLDVIAVAEEHTLPVHLLPGALEILLGRSPPRLTSYIPVVDIDRRGVGTFTVLIKRVVDILLGLTWLIVGAPARLRLRLAGNKGETSTPRIVYLPRLGAYRKSLRVPRLRFSTGLPASQARGVSRFIQGWQLFCGRLTLVGQPALSPRQFARLEPIARRFYRGTPGIFSLRRLRFGGAKVTVAERGRAALIYYARHASIALDIRILLAAWRKRSPR